MGDYGYYITCDQSDKECTCVLLSQRRGYTITVLLETFSWEKLQADVYSKYIFKHCKDKETAFLEFEQLTKELRDKEVEHGAREDSASG